MSKVVVVTGASAGVGRATAIAFAGRGDAVALLARGRAGLEAAARDVEAAGGRALVVPVDVSDAEAVEAAADRVERELGPIDVWVNNAMTAILAPVSETTPEEYRRVVEVTYLGSVWGAMAALKRMRARDRGHVVQVGSALARRGIPLQASYCGAKHGIQGFAESLRSELLHDGSAVKFSMVQLPGLNTTQFGWVRVRGLRNHPQPVPPVYQPEVAANAIVWISDHPRRELWVGRATIKTILGNWFAPGYEDRYLARNAYDGQQMPGKPLDPNRRDYLFDVLDDDADRGSHGLFDDQATTFAPEVWAAMHKWRLLGAAAAGGGALALRALLRR